MRKKFPSVPFIFVAVLLIALWAVFIWGLDRVADSNFVGQTILAPINGACQQDFRLIVDVDEKGIRREICVYGPRAKLEAIAKLGPIGDSFGILNSIFGILSLSALLVTLYLQKEQLSEQRLRFKAEKIEAESAAEKLRVQNNNLRETSLRQIHDRRVFDWLELHHRMVERVEVLVGRDGVYGKGRGAKAFTLLYDVVVFEAGNWINSRHDPTVNQPSTLSPKLPSEIAAKLSELSIKSKRQVREEFERFFQAHRNLHDSEFGHIFRNAYRLLKWIDEEDEIPAKRKWEYASTFRAQLSFGEISLMLLNAATEPSGKAAPLFSKYAMFENLPENDLLRVIYFGDARISQSAFDADIARAQLLAH